MGWLVGSVDLSQGWPILGGLAHVSVVSRSVGGLGAGCSRMAPARMTNLSSGTFSFSSKLVQAYSHGGIKGSAEKAEARESF